LVVDLTHRLIPHDVIRIGIDFGLYVGFLHPVVNGCSTALGTKIIEYLFGIPK
jgi:hypothetical protein